MKFINFSLACVFVIFGITIICIDKVSSHGYLAEPPSRSSGKMKFILLMHIFLAIL